MNKARRKRQGFTLVELMITLVVLGVMVGYALPAFDTYMGNTRVKTASFDLYSTLIFARSEAIKRRQQVTIAPVSGTDWTGGWRVQAGGTTLREQAALRAVSVPSAPASIIYRGDGRITAGSAVGILVVPAPAAPSIANRCIRVDLTGLPRTTATTGTTCP